MQSVNRITINNDRTVDIFNNFYSIALKVDAAEYDVVYSYFYKLFDADSIAAETFSVNLFNISQLTGQDALDMLSSIKGKDSITTTKLFCYYLNDIRSRSTLIGVSDPVKPNYYAARNVLI